MQSAQTIQNGAGIVPDFLKRPFQKTAAVFRLGWYLFFLDFQNQYRLTFFSYWWSGLKPVMSVLPLLLVGTQIDLLPKDYPVPYMAFALTGTLFFDVFWDSISTPLYYGRRYRKFVLAQGKAEWALLAAGICETLFYFCMRIVLVVPILLFTHVLPGWGILDAVLALPLLIVAGLAFAMPGICFNFIYRDLNHVLGFVRQILIWTAGVFYFVEEKGPLRTVYELNPITYLIEFSRNGFLGVPFEHTGRLIAVCTALLGIFTFSAFFFQKRVRRSVDYII